MREIVKHCEEPFLLSINGVVSWFCYFVCLFSYVCIDYINTYINNICNIVILSNRPTGNSAGMVPLKTVEFYLSTFRIIPTIHGPAPLNPMEAG